MKSKKDTQCGNLTKGNLVIECIYKLNKKHLKIRPMQPEDVLKGRIRINYHTRKELFGKEVKRKQSVKLIYLNSNQKKKCYRQLWGINKKDRLYIDFDTRDILEFKENNGKIIGILNFELVRFYEIWKYAIFYWQHPDDGIRVSFKLAMLSIVLGITSLVFALI